MTKEERRQAKVKEELKIRDKISDLQKEMKQAYATKDYTKVDNVMNQIKELRMKL